MNRLRGTRVTGRDGPIGLLNDVYFDASQWRVRYIALESTEPFSKCRLIVPAAAARIEGISDQEMLVDLRRAAISPNTVPGPELLSAREATSLRVEPAEGRCEPVQDVLVGIDWSVRGFLVGVSDWVLPGASVELASGSVERVDRERRVLCVRLTHRQIQRLPRAAWRMRRA